MRGQKQLHSLSEDKNILRLFSEKELVSLEKRGVTLESYHVFAGCGVDVKKCSQCKFWGNMRTLFHFTDGLMTSCVPCKPEKK